MNATETKTIEVKPNDTSRYRLLAFCILFDAIGMLSFTIPLVGEFSDVIWAPISAMIMVKLFKGLEGKIGGMVSFIEEIIPGLDFIPTFTLMWIYKFIYKKETI